MDNKNILITGGSSGIGLEIAKMFCQNNAAQLTILARNATKLEQTKRQLNQINSQCNVQTIEIDFSQPTLIKECLQKCLAFGVPDILINNVGVFKQQQFEQQDLQDLLRMFQVNVVAAYQLTQFFLPYLKKLPSAQIFNICSVASLIGLKNCSAYNVTKFALYGFGKALREELKETQIKVTNILPGATYTPAWGANLVHPERLINPTDIAQTVFSCSQLGLSSVVEDIIIRPQQGDL